MFTNWKEITDEQLADITFTEWVEMQHELQRHFEMDPDGYKGEDLANYVRWNTLAAIDELMELLAEWRWKPWDREDVRGTFEDRDAVVGELADILHFIANLALAAKISPKELAEAYRRKVLINYERKTSGYDARTKELTAREGDREAERMASATFTFRAGVPPGSV